jgi:predicted nucleotidyltransferase
MGQKPDKRIINFLKRLRAKYTIRRAILFGSRARGDHLHSSDYDIILVSDDFRDIFFTKRSALMYDFWRYWPLEIEPLCYTPEEFQIKKNQIGIVSQALNEGISL